LHERAWRLRPLPRFHPFAHRDAHLHGDRGADRLRGPARGRRSLTMKKWIAPALSGLLFALGLALAGMTDPAKVLGFLDFTGDWDPSLAFVMGGAMATYGIARFFILRRPAPIDGGSFPVYPKTRPD